MTETKSKTEIPIDDKYGGRFGEYKDAMEIYEDGKHRRYTLLFSVNGAVVAIFKVAPNSDTGRVGSWALAIGMIIFTGLMLYDIWIFGTRMRSELKEDDRGNIPDLAERRRSNRGRGVFSFHGRFVVIGSCTLITVGWLALAIWGPAPGHS